MGITHKSSADQTVAVNSGKTDVHLIMTFSPGRQAMVCLNIQKVKRYCMCVHHSQSYHRSMNIQIISKGFNQHDNERGWWALGCILTPLDEGFPLKTKCLTNIMQYTQHHWGNNYVSIITFWYTSTLKGAGEALLIWLHFPCNVSCMDIFGCLLVVVFLDTLLPIEIICT